MEEKDIKLSNDGNIATITLNRSKQMNAINGGMYDALFEAFDRMEQDDKTKAVIITAEGRAFCSGYDLNSRFFRGHGPGDREGTRNGVLEAGQLFVRLRKFSKPIIAAVNGYAIGGGLSLALASDVIVASEAAKFSDGHVNLATVPDCGLTYFLTRLLGTSRAFEFMLSGKTIDAKEAERIGLVNNLVAPENLASAAGELAQALSKAPLGLIQLVKPAIYHGFVADLESVLEKEAEAQAVCAGLSECREVAQAYFKKFKAKR
jgi:2-(1,2-epoxy-1,2-dihydrophenyl)acetyl-CoA isomerase